MTATNSLAMALLVGVGGFAGSLLRYAIGTTIYHYTLQTGFPYGTLTINMAGCLAIGILGGLADARSMMAPELRAFLIIGVLGGFTTFSTFGYDTATLFRDHEYAKMAANIGIQALAGPALALIGYVVAAR